jgi:hypothetical protein
VESNVFYFTDADFARVARNSAIDEFDWPQSTLDIKDNRVIVTDLTKLDAFRDHVLLYYPDWLKE